MTPRPIKEIISALLESEESKKDIVQHYINNIKEIYTHPKGEISKQLSQIDDKDIFAIRDELYLQLLDTIPEEDLEKNKIKIDHNNPSSNLRKRYKAHNCHDDMYLLAVSIQEKTPHKDILKTLITTNTSSPSNGISKADSALIAELNKMNKTMSSIQKENKELKSTLHQMNSKLDTQAIQIELLKKSNNSDRINATTSLTQLVTAQSTTATPTQTTSTASSQPISSQHASNTAVTNSTNYQYPLFSNGLHVNPFLADVQGFGNKFGCNSIQSLPTHGSYSPFDSSTSNNCTPFQQQHNNHHGISHIDEDGYEKVDRRRKKRNPPVYGSKSILPSQQKLAGQRIVRKFSLFIGGISNDVTPEILSSYIKDELKVTQSEVEINKINDYNRSYKVTVPRDNKDILFNPENWEKNIIVKAYRDKQSFQYGER